MIDILHGTPWFLRDVYLGSTTTQNVLVTGWQSQVAASAEGRRHFRHKSLAGEHCCGSNTGCRKAEHEPGGQGHPGMVAAGAATCSHPPTAKASDQRADPAPAWLEESSAWELDCAVKKSHCVHSLQALSLSCKCRGLFVSSLPQNV